jgi:hypothetical protein
LLDGGRSVSGDVNRIRVLADAAGFTFRHNEETAVRCDQKYFGIVGAIGIVAWNVSLTATESPAPGSETRWIVMRVRSASLSPMSAM